VSIAPPHVVAATEIRRFLLASRGGVCLYSMQELIWTKVGYVLGNLYPSVKHLSPAEELRLQIAFFNYLWEQPLIRLIDMIGDAPVPGDEFKNLSEETNRQNPRYAHELKSFEGTYDVELRGAVELAGEIAADVITEIAQSEGGLEAVPTARERADVVNMSRNLLYFAMKKQEHRAMLRSMHIQASLHASVRWDKQRKFRPNDHYDFEHATAALGYCDLFLTEGPLHVMVTRPQVNLQAINGCKVISDVAEAADWLRLRSNPERKRCA
jgi:hypothetical protein